MIAAIKKAGGDPKYTEFPGVNHNSAAIKTTMHDGQMDGFSQITGCKLKNDYHCYTQYYPSQIPNLAALAANYVISDRTFATEIG